VPVYLPSVGNVDIIDGFIPVLNVMRGIYTID
jgi:hypothetical protein